MRISCRKTTPKGRKTALLAESENGLIDHIRSSWCLYGEHRPYCRKRALPRIRSSVAIGGSMRVAAHRFRALAVEIELPNVFRGKTLPIVPLRRHRCHPSHCLCRLPTRSAQMTMRRVAPRTSTRHRASTDRRQPFGGSSLPSMTYSPTHPLTSPVSRRIEIRLGMVIRPSAMSPKAHTSSSE